MPNDRDDPVTDSPLGWVAQHVRRYVESDGQSGHRWSGVDTLLLTTRGRSTGKLRRTAALIYGKDPNRYIVVASNGGAQSHPHWYQNLAADSARVRAGRRSIASRREHERRRLVRKPRLWRLMVSIWPEYEKYQTKTEREIPVVILERLS